MKDFFFKKKELTIENKKNPNVTTKCKKTLQIYIMYMHSNFELGSGHATICLIVYVYRYMYSSARKCSDSCTILRFQLHSTTKHFHIV